MSVLVIGGGMVGLACGLYLAEAGHEVTLIDGGTVAGGCSSGNLGYVCPSHLLPMASPGALRDAARSLLRADAPFRMRPQADGIFMKWLWRFVRRANERQMLESAGHLASLLASARAEHGKLASRIGEESQWRARGLLCLFDDPDALEHHWQEEEKVASRFGTAIERIEAEALGQLEPGLREGLAGGYLFPDDACLRPERLASAMARMLRERGGTIWEHCEVSEILVERGQVTGVRTGDGNLSADHYVLATGVFSGRIGRQIGLDLPVVPGKGYSLTTSAFDGAPSRPLLFPKEHVGVTPFEDGFRVGSMMEFVGFDASVPARRIAQLRSAAARYLKAPLPAGDEGAWCGWRPMTPDSLPIIGKAPGIDNLVLATGHNMLGVTLAPVTGRLVREIIDGDAPHLDPAPFRADRW